MIREIPEDFVQSLMEGNQWSKFGVTVKGKVVTESKDEGETCEDAVTENEEHVCPLCESKLDEALSEDTIQEHIDDVLALVDQMNESDDDAEEDSDELKEAYAAIEAALEAGDLTEADVENLTKEDILSMLEN